MAETAEIVQEFSSDVLRWIREIEQYEQQTGPWERRAKRIIKRYRDERADDAQNRMAKFNMLWSNVQTLKPACFSKNPKANVERRFQDDDDLGRFASEALERCCDYYIDERYYETTSQAVLDRLLAGRATKWVRYVPTFEEITDEPDAEEQPPSNLIMEEIVNDYVHWQDFGHCWARTWEECEGAWRIAYMSRKELIKRFGKKVGMKIPLDYAPEKLNDERLEAIPRKASIYEIWDKAERMVYWLHKNVEDFLDTKDNPLKLKDFWPFPKPMFANLANDTLIPTPDYQEYQDQADELDELTSRITALTKAVKAAGVYDASAEGVERLLSEGVENTLIPVEQWAALGSGKGLEGVIAWLPLGDIVKALEALYKIREQVKKDAYEISGMSDIIRGEGDSNETATGVKTKGQFATLRLSAMQAEVSRFCRDEIRIMAEIISTQFSMETIREISGVKLLTVAEKQLVQHIQQVQSQAQQDPRSSMMLQQLGQTLSPQLKDLLTDPEALDEQMQNPTWEDVYSLLKNDTHRCFRIDVETDSTVKMDQTQERQDRTEFLQTAGGFLQQLMVVQDPAIQVLGFQMLMFGVRGFHVGKDMESAFKVAEKKLQKEAQNPQPKPDPKMQLEQMKAQMQQASAQQQQAHEQAIANKDAQLQILSLKSDQQIQAQKFEQERSLEQIRIQHEATIADIKAGIERNKLNHAAGLKGASDAAQHAHETEMAHTQHEHAVAQSKAAPKPQGKK